ncbi:MAG: ornithine carbamoyltransferase [Thiotrichales bacterium]
MPVQHFLTLRDLTGAQLLATLERAIELKSMHKRGERHPVLQGKTLGMIFDKSSTRTRVSFEVGMAHFGGTALFLSSRDTQLGRGEPLEDTARVLSRMVDGVLIRTHQHRIVEKFAEYSQVPVINGLTDTHHPCQLLADVMTFIEHRGSIAGKTVTWIGDGNNMCNSYIEAAIQFDFNLRISAPQGYDPDAELLAAAGARATIERDPLQAATDADLIVTDVWASMGQEEEQRVRAAAFERYQVDANVMQQANPDALFMHCLPAHRGEEVATEVLEGPQSVVWDEAENRLHAQKALLELLLAGGNR